MTLQREGQLEFAAGRAYYAMFSVAEALLNEQNLRFNKHSAVHAAYGKHFGKTAAIDPKFHSWLLDAFDERLEGDYGMEATVSAERVAEMIAQAREFLQQARQFLQGGPKTAE